MERCDGARIMPGLKQTGICGQPVFTCKCGNFGCNYHVKSQCSKQGFVNQKCLNCGCHLTSN